MIICSDEWLTAGARLQGELADADGTWHIGIPMLVLRTASREEYLAYCEQEGADSTRAQVCSYHYEVSID